MDAIVGIGLGLSVVLFCQCMCNVCLFFQANMFETRLATLETNCTARRYNEFLERNQQVNPLRAVCTDEDPNSHII